MGMQCLLAKVMERGIFRVPARRKRKVEVKAFRHSNLSLYGPPGGCPLAAPRCQKENRMSIYQRINGADWRNVWVVGDLHGCYTLLMNELDKVNSTRLVICLFRLATLSTAVRRTWNASS
jgi:hypothetical protein